MDFGTILDQTFAYTKESVWGRTKQWFILIGCLILFPLILGYMVRIYRGISPAPELKQWGTMFIDGLKLLVVEIVYVIPVILLVIIAFLPLFSTLIAGGALNPAYSSDVQVEQLMVNPEILSSIGLMVVLLLLAVICGIIITIFSFIGVIRFARTGSMAEAFNFSAIISQIRRIGWLNYLLALVVISVIGFIFGMFTNVFSLIPIVGDTIGLIVMIVLYVPFIIFSSRYATLVYENGEEKPEPVSALTGV
ncbi:MAG: DUF4013 domain-containing protein [Methanoregula sp.]|nr:DUF4013 domain-containing protein [Methanoregula sp.]